MAHAKNLIGYRSGKLLAVKRVANKGHHVQWECVCDCGQTKIVCAGMLQKGATRSCGCLYRGPNHHHWKGGRKIRDGYVEVLIGANRYAKEHRLIMEQHVGRKLKTSETVHHKNGIRHDNRIENLELWIGNHGYGQRVADLPFADGSEEYFNLAA